MEGGHDQIALARRHDRVVLQSRQDFHLGPHPLDAGRPNEHRLQWLGTQGGHGQIGFETVDLPTVGIARHADIHQVERRYGLAIDFAR